MERTVLEVSEYPNTSCEPSPRTAGRQTSTATASNATEGWQGSRPGESIARPLYQDEDLGLDLDNTVYALDSSTIDLSLNGFSWARFRSTKGVVNIRALMDLQGSIPSFLLISDGKLRDVKVLDELPPEPGAIYVVDRAYIDFVRRFRLQTAGALFVVRAKSNLLWRRR